MAAVSRAPFASASVSASGSSCCADLREAAEQFEAIFLNQWIKQARNTKLAEDILGSSSTDQYQEMLDREYASSLASGVNLGIAEALIRQFEGQGK